MTHMLKQTIIKVLNTPPEKKEERKTLESKSRFKKIHVLRQ